MGSYDAAQICLNGHVINSCAHNYPEHNQKFCDKCGKSTIINCPNCNTHIRGHYHETGIIGGFHFTAPSFCYQCGKPYPWTEKAISAAKEMAELMEGLSDPEKEEYRKNVQDIILETPQTKIAAYKIVQILKKVGSKTAEIAKDLLVDFASETAKKIITGI